MEPPTTSTSAAVTMTQLPEMYGHSRKVYALEYNSNGSLLASGSNDRTIRIWFVDSVRRARCCTGWCCWRVCAVLVSSRT